MLPTVQTGVCSLVAYNCKWEMRGFVNSESVRNIAKFKWSGIPNKQTNQHAKCTTVYNSVVSRPLISCCINFQNLRIAFENTTEPQNVPSYSKQPKTPSSIIRAIRSNTNSLELLQGSSITSHCRP